MTTWRADVLGENYEQHTIELGSDPDGEGEIVATLVRYVPPKGTVPAPHSTALYIHGYSDYFFQRHLADRFAAQGYRFYALDLRKCGRSQRPGLTPHFVTDLALYDEELNEALRLIRKDAEGDDAGDGGAGTRVIVAAHSTGGLIAPLWVDRLNREPGGARGAGIRGLVLNSPWLDMQGSWWLRSIGTAAIEAVGRVQPMRIAQDAKFDGYGTSLHADRKGEWEYNLDWKPHGGYPARFGWLRAIRRGHFSLQRGLDVGVPALILRSSKTWFSPHYVSEIDSVDCVLDVKQIARWAGCMGNRTLIVPIPGARHDVFLSQKGAREEAFRELGEFLSWLPAYDGLARTASAAVSTSTAVVS
ncbi:alpha/beta hydrolase [Hoyosella subflava]|uniref:Serine aminopeptidase S33 domain-containing protein n=1 Tax=Hoyosella subflava (strain DSM 45089 / JCM 17490 / NBRC 109087 / DQS3-9A1) TaxID=443218 RepID=F6EIZ5_HOYSD|nr:alpha/beta hydrolase [Hoyosella subflava]AEF40056.1 hypothetical protein AS9A_1607 [Hoyosella subflava DQS3-9A1]